jgi:hypothetical protein
MKGEQDMKRMTLVVLLVMGLMMFIGLGLVFAQQGLSNPQKKGESVAPAQAEPPSPPSRREETVAKPQRPQMKRDPERMRMMMERMGVPSDMIEQGRIMMKAELYMDGPAVLRARAEELGLSKEQQQKLQEIMKKAQDEALKSLKDEQKQKLGKPDKEPMTINKLFKKMGEKMKEHSGRDDTSMMLGLMMAGLIEVEEEAPSTPEPEKTPETKEQKQ